jgi:asparagine synthase (glutamine-hydrolysing)
MESDFKQNMCGIAGYKTSRRVADDVLPRMVEAVHHRGPDGAGYFRGGDFAGGMRRLAIVDLAHGEQPFRTEDGAITMFYNGEIYNYPSLRRSLEDKGYHFRSHCDGEVIPFLYREHGEALFELLDGMFAVALWIGPEKKLVLARDIPGEKPLHYAELAPGEIVFGSEIEALKPFPGIDLSLDRQALWDFPTFLWIPEPRTAYLGIKALPRSHILVADDTGTRLKRYENRFNLAPLPARDEASVVAETRRVVEDAVKSRLLSDVPVGSFLSGGLDSSIVATISAQNLPTLDTFSVGFEDIDDPYHGRADESEAAAATAARIGARHHTIRITGNSFRNEIDRFCRHGDQPFAVSSGFGILAVSKAARDAGIKVLMTGDGADEMFGGYSWYTHLDGRGRCGTAAPEGIVSFQNFGLPLAERLAALDAMPQPMRAWAWHYYAHEEEKAALFSADFREGLHSSLRQFEGFRSDKPWDAVDFVAQDRELYFPQEMLRKCDRMTMAYSVEGRVPFAAPAVLSHADKLSFAHMVAPDGTLKHVLRKAFADILPPEVIARPKHGFNVPIDHWLKHEWADMVEDVFAADSALNRQGILAPGARQAALAMLQDKKRLNGHTIFCMIMLNKWLQTNAH